MAVAVAEAAPTPAPAPPFDGGMGIGMDVGVGAGVGGAGKTAVDVEEMAENGPDDDEGFHMGSGSDSKVSFVVVRQ